MMHRDDGNARHDDGNGRHNDVWLNDIKGQHNGGRYDEGNRRHDDGNGSRATGGTTEKHVLNQKLLGVMSAYPW